MNYSARYDEMLCSHLLRFHMLVYYNFLVIDYSFEF